MSNIIFVTCVLLSVSALSLQDASFYSKGNSSTPGGYINGDFALSWRNLGTMTFFLFVTRNISNRANLFSAFVLSNDTALGNDDVIVCGITSYKYLERYYISKELETSLLSSSIPEFGLSNFTISYANDNLICSFLRVNANSSIPRYFDIKNKAYVHFTSGLAPNGNNIILDRLVEGTTLIDFNTNDAVVESPTLKLCGKTFIR